LGKLFFFNSSFDDSEDSIVFSPATSRTTPEKNSAFLRNLNIFKANEALEDINNLLQDDSFLGESEQVEEIVENDDFGVQEGIMMYKNEISNNTLMRTQLEEMNKGSGSILVYLLIILSIGVFSVLCLGYQYK
jgi:hypothetical protein